MILLREKRVLGLDKSAVEKLENIFKFLSDEHEKFLEIGFFLHGTVHVVLDIEEHLEGEKNNG
jgi:hypothetical protein